MNARTEDGRGQGPHACGRDYGAGLAASDGTADALGSAASDGTADALGSVDTLGSAEALGCADALGSIDTLGSADAEGSVDAEGAADAAALGLVVAAGSVVRRPPFPPSRPNSRIPTITATAAIT